MDKLQFLVLIYIRMFAGSSRPGNSGATRQPQRRDDGVISSRIQGSTRGSGPTHPRQDTGVTAVAGLYCLLAHRSEVMMLDPA